MTQITNGKISYGRTMKTGDYESKRADVELSFNLADGEDHDVAIEHVGGRAQHHCMKILDAAQQAAAEKKSAVKPAKMPVVAAKTEAPAKPTNDAAAVEEPEKPNGQKKLFGKEPDAAAVTEENGLDDIMGGTEAPPKEITDKEIMDATQRRQAEVKNAVGIKKILTEILAASNIKVPPGRVIDIPQARRQEYLDRLKEVKPLA